MLFSFGSMGRILNRNRVKGNLANNHWQLFGIKFTQALRYKFDYYHYCSGHFTEKASIREINLEFCSIGNAISKFSVSGHTNSKSYMSTEILDRVFNDLLYDKRFSRVATISLYDGGETFLHSKRLELLRRVKLHKALWNISGKKFPRITLISNGILLRESQVKELLEINVINEIGFNLDSDSIKAFEDLKMNGGEGRFVERLKMFIKLKDIISPEVKIIGVGIAEKPHAINSGYVSPEIGSVINILDRIDYRLPGDTNIDNIGKVNETGCNLLLKQLTILPDGSVSVCCNDLNSKGIVGSVLGNSLYDIYFSGARLKYVRKLYEGKKKNWSFAGNCISY